MNADIYNNSIQLDELVSEKLKSFLKNNLNYNLTVNELKNELNNLRYLLYVINQDRIV